MASSGSEKIAPKCSLLSMLPKPKNSSLIKEKVKPITLLKPSSVSNTKPIAKQINNQPEKEVIKEKGIKRPLVEYDSDNTDALSDESEEGNNVDFFGFDAKTSDFNIPTTSISPIQKEMIFNDVFIGPAKPPTRVNFNLNMFYFVLSLQYYC